MSDFDWTPHLNDGEHVIWQGRPSSRLFVFRTYDAFIIPFSILWGIISLAALIFGIIHPAMPIASGLIFSVLALYMGIGRFYVSQKRRNGTRYALTNTRALIARATGGQAPDSMARTPDLPISLRKDRVTFGPAVSAFTNQSSRAAMSGRDADFTFCGLVDAKAVYDLADAAKQAETP